MKSIFIILLSAIFSSCKSQTSSIPEKNVQTAHIDSIYKPVVQLDISDGIVYFSFNNGATWENKSQGLPKDVFLTDIAISDKHLAVTTKQNGIFLFDFQTNTWAGLSMNPLTNNVDALYFHQNKMFAGTQHGGVFISNDQGKTWTSHNNGLRNLTIRKLAVIDNKLYAGTNGGLFSWNDMENKWEIVYGDNQLQVNGITEASGEIYIGTNHGAYKSSKYFRDWKLILPNRSLHNIDSDGQIVYAMVYNELFFSNDKGLTWQSMQKGLPAELYSFQVMKKDNVVLVGQWDGVYKRETSENLKAGWAFSSKGLPSENAVTEMKIYKDIIIIGCSKRKLRTGVTTNK
jgi:ligand-binding sensor domain-containing protein